MAPAYKLHYFDVKGAAEAVRYLFKYGNIDFEDIRIKHEDWPKLKESTPFGQLPYLEHNGKKINQSIAICRYLGHIVKLDGKDEWENLEIDAAVDTLTDLRSNIRPFFLEKDETKKKGLKEKLVNETMPFYLTRFEALTKKNNGYLAAGKLTWADFVLAAGAGSFENILGEDIFQSYPNLKALIKKVEELPAIKKWIEVRPQSAF